MESRQRAIIAFIFLIVLIFGLYFFADWFSKVTGYNIGDDPDIELAKCLTKKGVIFYGDNNCPQCKKQEDIFGPTAFNYINHIDCSSMPGDCAILEKIPAWKINGTTHYGIKTINEIKKLSLCD